VAQEADETNHLQSKQMAQVKKGLSVALVAVGAGLMLALFVMTLLYMRESNRTERLQQELEDIRTLPEALQMELEASRKARAKSELAVDSLMRIVAAADQSIADSKQRMKRNTLKKNEDIARIRQLDDYGLLEFITDDLAKVDTIQE
jgi:biopolymer transport protein ExbB/TolQ